MTMAHPGSRGQEARSNRHLENKVRWKAGKALLCEALFEVVPRQTRLRLALTLLLSIVGAISVVVAPILFARAVDLLVERANITTALVLIASSIAVFGLAKVLVEQRWLIYQPAENRLLNAFRNLYLRHILTLPVSFHANRAIGRLDATVGQGMGGLQSLLSAFVTQAMPLLLEVTAILVAATALLSFDIAAIIGVSIVLYTGVLIIGAERVSRRYRGALNEAIIAQGLAGDAILNAEGVKALAVEDAIVSRYNASLDASHRAFRAFYAARGLFGLCLTSVLLAGFAITIAITTRGVLADQQTIGNLVLTNTYLLQLFRSIESFSFSYRDARQSLTAVTRFIDLFLEEKEDDRGKLSVPEPIQKITVNQVGFSYPDGRRALDSLSLTIDRGKITALIGESGSGKSTLIRLLLKLYHGQEGVIRIDGTPIEQLDTHLLRRQTALVPQDAIMFKASLSFNVALTDEPDRVSLMAAIESAQLSGLIKRLPDGLETEIGERGLKLSGGERQRISIARALYRNPQIFLLDEATSALDDVTRDDVLGTIRALAPDFATLIITHDPAVAAIADQVVKIAPSPICEQSPVSA